MAGPERRGFFTNPDRTRLPVLYFRVIRKMRTTLAALALLGLASCDRPGPAGTQAKPALAMDDEEGFGRKDAKSIEIGTFEVASDQLVVSDPCYSVKDEGLHGNARPVRRGRWKATIVRIDAGDWGHRNAELIAVHSGAAGTPSWKKQEDVLGVDSGQLGVFDRARYSDDTLVPKDYQWKDKPIDPEQPWYSLCCEKTLSDAGAGVVPFGAVSSSGLGDGAYEWFLWKEKEEVVGVKVLFLRE